MAEAHGLNSSNSRLNWIRAAVLGANDGIVSLASLTVGVAGASNSTGLILTVGVAGLIAGALSMALGEYVSVSSQLDVEQLMLKREREAHESSPEDQVRRLTEVYENRGVSNETARKVAEELAAKDSYKALVDAELNIDPEDLSNPLQAAFASGVSFTSGGIIPLIAMVASPVGLRIPITFIAVLIALVLTGVISAKVSGVGKGRATIRVVIGGLLAMAVTFLVGRLFGVSNI